MLYFPSDLTGDQVNKEIRQHLHGRDFTSLVFIVDNVKDRKLLGTVHLRDLLLMKPSESLEQVMDPYVDALEPFQPASAAAYRILDSGLAAMPVVAHEGRLVGAMTVDAALTQLVAPNSELRMLRVFS
jgi:magnesium transporter